MCIFVLKPQKRNQRQYRFSGFANGKRLVYITFHIRRTIVETMTFRQRKKERKKERKTNKSLSKTWK
jgi:hypothetical protein